MSYKVEAVTKALKLGEGAHWDVATQTLYFVDILKGSVHSYKPSTNEHNSAVIGNGSVPVSFIIPIEGQKCKFLISLKNELAIITWDGKNPCISKPEVINSVEPNDNANKLNDAKCDACGRLWASTMMAQGTGPNNSQYDPVGSLYSIDKGNVKKQLENLSIPNGLTWSLDCKTFYFIDSIKHRVDAYDFNMKCGTVSNEKTVFDFKANCLNKGHPDGMTINVDGILYVAHFEGEQVITIDPKTCKLLSNIKIPAVQVTSVAFGGANLDELYVTTGNYDTDNYQASADENGPNGCLYKVTCLNTKGLPMTNVKIC